MRGLGTFIIMNKKSAHLTNMLECPKNPAVQDAIRSRTIDCGTLLMEQAS